MSVYKWSETGNYQYHKLYANDRPATCNNWRDQTYGQCETVLKPNMLVYVCFDMSTEEDTICLDCASFLFDVTIEELLQEYKCSNDGSQE